MKTEIKIERLFKFKKKWMRKKARRVVVLMNEVINSDKFKKEILDYDFKDRRYRLDPKEQHREITDNQEIYDILMRGHEQNSEDGVDYTWKLRIALGRFNDQVGRRQGNLITTQNWFLKIKGNEAKVASHWFHEYAHMLGFYHDKKKTPIRPYSVPYALNEIVEKVLLEREK